MTEAHLIGSGWGRWRGSWSSRARLVGAATGWRLDRAGRSSQRFSSHADALRCLWPLRSRRDDRPWAVGWIGYEELARIAGDLPARAPEAGQSRGCWLIEPEPGEGPGSQQTESVCPATVLSVSLDAAAYRAGVETIRACIASGDVYQVSLTRRFTFRPWVRGLAPLVEAACAGGAPDYLSRLPMAGGELLCGSMELLLRRRGVHLETRPIKGTRPRGVTPADDSRLMAELDTDPKERAELSMIVDLERNDLSRVADTASVRVDDPGRVHTYATLHHRVARVSASCADTTSWWHLLAAVAPGGSVTGCPKRAAMEVIAGLEPVPRGPFSGVVGVVAGNGDLELALAIRSAWLNGDRLDLAAGCGIVWDSDPVAEERESRLKIARWLDLAGTEHTGRDLV